MEKAWPVHGPFPEWTVPVVMQGQFHGPIVNYSQ